MGLFGKRKEEKRQDVYVKQTIDSSVEPIESNLLKPNDVIHEIQNHLKISAKLEIPVVPSSISISKIPNPEIFKKPIVIDEQEEPKAVEPIEKQQSAPTPIEEEQPQQIIEESTSTVEPQIENEIIEPTVSETIPNDNEVLETVEEIQEEEEETLELIEETQVEDQIEKESSAVEPIQDDIIEEVKTEVVEETIPEQKIDTSENAVEEVEELVETKEETLSSAGNKVEEAVEEIDDPQEVKSQNNDQAPTPIEETTEVVEEIPKEEKVEDIVEQKAEPVKDEQQVAAKPVPVIMPTISTISASTIKIPKGRKPVKAATAKQGGVAAAKAAEEELKDKLEEQKRESQAAKAAAIRAAEKEAEIARLAFVTLIGDAKKPEPSLGKFEITKSTNPEKPYKFLLKTENGKVVFESAAIKTKPNELTALMFKDIMNQGSFNFVKTPQGFMFRILDSRKRLFCLSKTYASALDAQKAAAIIKKYGLSANYIDDNSNN